MGECGGLSEKSSLVKLAFGSQKDYIVDRDVKKDKDNGGTETRNGVSPSVIINDVDRDANSNEQAHGVHSCAETQETEHGTDADRTGRFSLTKTPFKKKAMLLLCAFAVFLSGSSSSLIAIFFPQEAQSKGMSLKMIGFVFGVFELVMFVASPFVGNSLSRIGVKFVCLSGIFLNGASTIIFGVLDKGPSGPWFAAMCIVCRTIEAAGFTALFIACMAIVSNEFHEQIGIMSAVLESSLGVAFTIGPVIGGQLYQLGGYGLPFYSIGGCVLLNGLVLYVFLPEIQTTTKKENKNSMFRLLRSPTVVISFFSICLATAGISMYESLFSPHMSEFNLSASGLGWAFMPGPLTYVVFTVFWGYVSNYESLHQPLLVLGQMVFGFAFIVNEPSRFLSFIPFEMSTVTCSYVLINICVALLQIFGMRCMVNGAYQMKFEQNVDTYAMVAGLYKTAFSCGGFCGPTAGGVTADVFGISSCYTTFGLVNICFVLVLIAYFLFPCIKRKIKTMDRVLCGKTEKRLLPVQ